MYDAIRRLTSLSVGDVMASHVFPVSASQSMDDAAEMFVQHDISSAPVIDEQGQCVGMLSASDFLRRNALSRQRDAAPEAAVDPSSADDECAGGSGPSAPRDCVLEYMSGGVQSVPQHSTLLHAAEIMDAQHIHRLPVLDGAGRPVGIVSTMDIVAALRNAIAETGLAT